MVNHIMCQLTLEVSSTCYSFIRTEKVNKEFRLAENIIMNYKIICRLKITNCAYELADHRQMSTWQAPQKIDS